MIATKELVGEQYHIHGVGLPPLNQASSIRPAKDAWFQKFRRAKSFFSVYSGPFFFLFLSSI